MQANQGGFSISQGGPISGGLFSGYTPTSQNQTLLSSNWAQISPFDEMALGQSPSNAPKQTSGVNQGIELLNYGSKASDAASSGGSVLNKLTSSDPSVFGSSNGMLTSAVNSIGEGLGFASGVPTGAPLAGGIGPTNNVFSAGSLGTKATLSGTLGAAGLGSFTGKYLGKLFGGSAQGGSVGGGIGAGLGFAVGGPVGGVIGNVAGSLLGSFFGGKKPNPAGNVHDISIGESGFLSGGNFAGKHTNKDTFNPQMSDFDNYLQSQVQKYGIKIDPSVKLYLGYDVNGTTFNSSAASPYQLRAYKGTALSPEVNSILVDPSTTFDWNNPESRNAAYDRAFREIAQLSGYDPSKLTPKNTIPTQAGAQSIQSNNQESPFDKFLREYREKQSANLA